MRSILFSPFRRRRCVAKQDRYACFSPTSPPSPLTLGAMMKENWKTCLRRHKKLALLLFSTTTFESTSSSSVGTRRPALFPNKIPWEIYFSESETAQRTYHIRTYPPGVSAQFKREKEAGSSVHCTVVYSYTFPTSCSRRYRSI